MKKYILAVLLGVALAGCQKDGPVDPDTATEFTVSGNKITVHGKLNPGATVKAEQAKAAVNVAVQMFAR